MVLDLLSTDMQISFNLKLAHRIGLHAAIYLGELLNINKKAVIKNKVNDGGFFKIDRGYIEQRTTLTKPEQKELDETLKSLQVLRADDTNKDLININVDSITGLLLDDNDTLVDKVVQPIRKKRVTKADAIRASLKEAITATNPELKAAYEEWIDAVILRQGWMSVASIKDGQELVDKYTNRDLDIALGVIRIGAINGWRDMSWAINAYEKERLSRTARRIGTPTGASVPSTAIGPNVALSSEVF